MRINCLILFIAIMLSSASMADPSTDLSHFFNQLGFEGNITQSHSFSTQAAGFVSLGSAFERNQVRQIQIMHVDVPGFRSGCGGINLFAGAFSFIKSDQIVKFMQNIVSNGGGYALNLAFETELPEIAHAMQYMQSIANNINNQNLNSCALSEDLVGGLWPKSRAASQQICQDIGMQHNRFSDWAEAKQQCTAGGEIDQELDDASKDPAYKDRLLRNTNVIWDAIQKNNFLAHDEKLAELYLSISGTLIFDAKGAPQTYPSLINNRNFIKALLYGGELPSYHCKDTDQNQCLNLDPTITTTQTIAPKDALVAQVEALLEQIYQSIITDVPLTNQAINFINMTSNSPVFSMLVADAEARTGVQGIHVLAEAMATELLAQYLNEAVGIIRASLAGKDLGAGNEKTLYDSLNHVRETVESFDRQTRQDFNQALNTNVMVQKVQANAVHALPVMLRQNYEDD